MNTKFKLLLLTVLVSGMAAALAGQVKMPLKDYLALVEKAEQIERAAAAAVPEKPEPPVAEVVSQVTGITLHNEHGETVIDCEVLLQGSPLQPVLIPVPGLVRRVTVTPPEGAAAGWTEAGLRLVATRPGRYAVHIEGAVRLNAVAGISRIDLPGVSAPVGLLRVDLPAGLTWSCPGVTVARDEVEGERRRLELAVRRGQKHALRVNRQLKAGETEKALVRAVAVTILTVRPEGVRRHEVLLYEVSRGTLAILQATLPEGFELDRLATDEGEQPALSEENRVTVQRTALLSGTGFLALTAAPVPPGRVSLAPVKPEVEVRARYLVLASSLAAEAAPMPAAAWQRVDVDDLPEAIRPLAPELKINAVWQGSGAGGDATLELAVLPAAPASGTVAGSRESTTLLTREGTMLHRDRFVLQQAGHALELSLAPGSVLWSAEVDGLPVRTLERGGATLIPLALGAKLGTAVTTVVVHHQAIPAGRSSVRLVLPELKGAVLQHQWRVLLPEENKYRLTGGSLSRVDEYAREREPREEFLLDGANIRQEPCSAGWGEIGGTVKDNTGSVIPGVSVSISSSDGKTKRQQVTSDEGRFAFMALPAGEYQLRSELEGFKTYQVIGIQVNAGWRSQVPVIQTVAEISELVTVCAGSVSTQSAPRPSKAALEEAQNRQQAAAEIANLQNGLTGGVKPVPVQIPPGGKTLFLAGALPSPSVFLELEIKAGK